MTGRVALITGGAGGIGAATAARLAAQGAHVVVADVDAARGTDVAEACGGLFVRTDVGTVRDNARAVARAVGEYGRLDVVVLNAAVPGQCGLHDFTPRRYRNTMRTNLDGVVYGMHACLAQLRGQRSGDIVVTSSIAGLTTSADLFYAAGKHALIGLVRSAAPLLDGDGVRINAVCPGLVDTPVLAPWRTTLHSHGLRLAAPEEVAVAVETILADRHTGRTWVVQAGRPAAPIDAPDIPLAVGNPEDPLPDTPGLAAPLPGRSPLRHASQDARAGRRRQD
ncbi:SDR family NAD(P)-dependent oxidoreductase [Streptomyces sp. NPDC048650]|uniref:SDR family NAD(P)-dependent oxidoreductase n=1 Tax=unclassified Streptomyces TaxID=2593676 RepID=UPI003713F2D4